MEQGEMRKRRWFWVWQDAKEEAWLEEMSEKGWQLQSVTPLQYTLRKSEPRGDTNWLDNLKARLRDLVEYLDVMTTASWKQYTFRKSEPRRAVYRLDYLNQRLRDLGEYLEFFTAAGWQYIGTMAGWHYFSHPGRPGQSPEIYTDAESKIAKYRRIQTRLALYLPWYMVPLFPVMDRMPLWLAILFTSVYVTLTVLLLVSLIKVNVRIKQLERKH